MLNALALALVLSAEETAGEPLPLAPEVEDTRVRRIGITLLAGGAGIAAPLLVGVGLEAAFGPCTGPFLFTCKRDRGQAVTASFIPITASLGLGLAHSLNGGQAGAGFGLAGALAGYMSGLMALGLVSIAMNKGWADTYPAAGAGILSAFALVGAVGAMELRHSEIEAGAPPWRIGRSLATGAVYAVSTLPTGAVFVWLATATRSGEGVALTLIFGTAVTVALASTTAWGVHRFMNGKGTFSSALVGGFASLSIACGFLALHAHAPPAGGLFNGPGTSMMIWPLAVFTGLLAAAGPAVGLEWTNGAERQDDDDGGDPPKRRRRDEPVQVRFQGGFAPGGGTFGLAGTF